MPKPGEVSLSHNGVLFLDELPEFKKNVLEVMRQPLEEGKVTISRALSSLTFPSSFMLIAAMNPCPVRLLHGPQPGMHLHLPQILRYRSKISGPLMDRIDIHVEVPAVKYRDLTGRRLRGGFRDDQGPGEPRPGCSAGALCRASGFSATPR